MSTLGFCNLDEAFNTNTKLNKKKKKYSRKVLNEDDHNIMDKILNRGEEINEPLMQDEDKDKDKDNIDSLATTYDKNSLFVKNRQEKLLEDKNKDLIPNEWQNKRNLESKEEIDELRLQILNLTDVVNDLSKNIKGSNNMNESKKELKEGYVNYNIDENIVNRSNNKISFDNDQFNELLLYIFTNIFLLILIDYIYNLGKNAF